MGAIGRTRIVAIGQTVSVTREESTRQSEARASTSG